MTKVRERDTQRILDQMEALQDMMDHYGKWYRRWREMPKIFLYNANIQMESLRRQLR